MRPQPDILMSTQREYNDIDVIVSTQIYSITFRGQHVTLRLRQPYLEGQRFKYPRCQFPTKKVAENLANKLNAEFNTTDFAVVALYKTL